MLTIPRRGLIAEYYLNGDPLDTSGNGYHGTATNVTRLNEPIGYQNKVASFNGSSSYIGTTQQIIPNGGVYTISFFVKRTATTGAIRRIISTTTGTFGSGTICFRENNGYEIYIIDTLYNVSTDANIFNDNYTHVVISGDGQNTKIYFDTKLIFETARVTSTPETGFYIGGYYSGTNTEYWQGNIGLVRVYNRVLTESKIRLLYLEGLQKLTPSRNAYPSLMT